MRVPGEVIVEHYANVPDHGALTDRVVAEKRIEYGHGGEKKTR